MLRQSRDDLGMAVPRMLIARTPWRNKFQSNQEKKKKKKGQSDQT